MLLIETVKLPWNLWLGPTNHGTDDTWPVQQNSNLQLRNQTLLNWGMVSF